MISYIKKDDKQNIKEITPSEQDLLKITCPKCNSVGRFYFHGYYTRFLYVVLLVVNHFLKEKISVKVARLKCQNCAKTHAVLHHDIIPYNRYSLSFITEVLASFFISKNKISKICIEFEISEKLFYTFLDYYKRELPELKAFFKGQILDEEEIFEEFILNITDSLIGFFLQTKRHFFHFKATNTFSKYPICHFHIIFFVSS